MYTLAVEMQQKAIDEVRKDEQLLIPTDLDYLS